MFESKLQRQGGDIEMFVKVCVLQIYSTSTYNRAVFCRIAHSYPQSVLSTRYTDYTFSPRPFPRVLIKDLFFPLHLHTGWNQSRFIIGNATWRRTQVFLVSSRCHRKIISETLKDTGGSFRRQLERGEIAGLNV